MTTSPPSGAPAHSGRGRRVAVSLLLIVACVLAPLSLLAVWTRNTLLDRDQYVSTVAPLATNPAIIKAAAAEITSSIVSEKTVETKIKAALPSGADFIAPAVASSLVAVVNGLAVKVLSSESFQTLWARANERAHTQFVNVLTGKGSKTITTNNGQVAVDLGAAVTQVQQRLDGLGINVFSGADAKRAGPHLVLFQSDDLKSGQSATNLLQKSSVVLPIITLLLFAAAIALSRNRRKTVLHAVVGISALVLVLPNHPGPATVLMVTIVTLVALAATEVLARGAVRATEPS